MKYICFILVIILLPLLVLAYNQIQRKPLLDNAAIIIDNTIVTRDDFARLSAEDRPPYRKTRAEVIDSIVTRQILVAEARKRGIDRRESFRWAMENYYEQSLVKALMNEVQETLPVTVTEPEIDRFVELLDSTIHYTAFTHATLPAAETAPREKGVAASIPFADLGTDMKDLFLGLAAGESTAPIPRDTGYVVYRLDRIEAGAAPSLAGRITAEAARAMLLNHRKKEALDNWIAGLRDRADVQLLIEP